MTDHQQQQETLFQTPDPVKLRQQAEEDPMLAKLPDREADLDEPESGETETDALSSSPIITANLSAG